MLESFEPIFDFLRGQNSPVFLVGGAVRDMLLGQPVHDLDFTVLGDAPRLARQIANHLRGAYYLMDSSRRIARVLIDTPDRKNLVLDFSVARGGSLESDISARDFTINAIAMDIHTRQIIDPLQGALHLREKILEVCSPDSFDQDPIRVLRAFRFSLQLNLRLTSAAKQALFRAVPALVLVSGERQRDELYRLMSIGKSTAALRLLQHAGILNVLLPDLMDLLRASFTDPSAGFEVCARSVEYTDSLINFMEGKREQIVETLFSNLVLLHLGRFRLALLDRLQTRLNADRPLRGLLVLTGMYFPGILAAAPLSRSRMPEGIRERFKFFAFSRAESEFFTRVLTHAGAFFDLVDTAPLQPEVNPAAAAAPGPAYLTRRQIFRYFKTTGVQGIEICLLSLAWVGANQARQLDAASLTRMVVIAAELFSAFFENYNEVIDPSPLLSGDDLMNHLNLPAGGQLGGILERIKEEQAAGVISSRQQAFEFVKSLI